LARVSAEQVMFEDNHHYGHSDVLRRYCGASELLKMERQVQHGWQPGPGLAERHLRSPWAKAVWSARNLRKCADLGARNVEAIGAPFLYLPDSPGEEESLGPRSLLVYPFHGWAKQSVLGDMHSFAVRLHELERVEGFGPITVCLYHLEYADPAIRDAFERYGWTVVTLGSHANNPNFLDKQRAMQRRHAYVTSNRVATATFYSLVSGCRFFCYGPPMGLSESKDPSGEEYDAWQRAEFPMLTFEGFGDRGHVEVGEAELGLEYKRSPEQLAELVGWRGSSPIRRIGLRMRVRAWEFRSSIQRKHAS
jgi:hypothetical protein